MFGFFRKRGKAAVEADMAKLVGLSIAQTRMVSFVGDILKVNLDRHRERSNFEKNINSRFFRGYLFGYFGSAAKVLGKAAPDSEELVGFILLGHFVVLDCSFQEATAFMDASMPIQNDPAFIDGIKNGGQDYFTCALTKSPRLDTIDPIFREPRTE